MPEKTTGKKKSEAALQPEDTSYIGSILSYNGFQPQPIQNSSNTQQDFYEQYKRVLGISYEIKKQINNQLLLKEELLQKMDQLEKNMENSNVLEPSIQLQRKESIKKRSRRMADQIQRKYKCSVEFCEKEYGSEGSLIQHIKLKHPDLYQSKY